MGMFIIKSPGRYYQFNGSINCVYELVKHLGNKFILVTTETNYGRTGDLICESFPEGNKPHIFFVDNKTTIESLLGDIKPIGTPINGVIGVGGGSVLDITKHLSIILDRSCVLIPTVSSNDSACTSMIVPRYYDNKDTMMIRMNRNPDIVIVDPEVLIKVPKRLTVSGIGDALATYYEAKACYETFGITMSHGITPEMFMTFARNLRNTLLKVSLRALRDIDHNIVSGDVEDLILATIYQSGVLSENCGLSVPHAFSLACDEASLFPEKTHGEKVAYGTLLLLYLEFVYGNNLIRRIWAFKEFFILKKFLKSVGLPTSLKDLGNYTVKNIEDVAVSIQTNKLFKNLSIRKINTEYLIDAIISLRVNILLTNVSNCADRVQLRTGSKKS